MDISPYDHFFFLSMSKLTLIYFFTASLLVSAAAAQLNPEPKKITRKFFPNDTVKIPTPAFKKKKGFTDYKAMMPYLLELQKEHPELVNVSFIGQSQKGYKIPMVLIEDSTQSNPKLRVWLQGGLHGNEPGSTESMLYLLHEILKKPQYRKWLKHLKITMVPMANVDGSNKQNRYAANGLDLNRDQTKLMIPESTLLKNAMNAFDPQVALDFHEYRPYRRDYAKLSEHGVAPLYDVMFLYTGNQNVPLGLRQYIKNRFVANAKEKLAAHGRSSHDYFTARKVLGSIHFNQGSVNARSSATNYALTNAVSTLIEVRGVGIGRTSFTRRVQSAFLVAESYLETAYQHRTEVLEKLSQARESQHQATVKSIRHISQKPVKMIDIATQDEITLDAVVRDAWKNKATLTRKRPKAYILKPEAHQMALRLKTLGLRIDTLRNEVSLPVEAYEVIAYSLEHKKYEGVYRQKVQTKLSQQQVKFPKNSYVVYLEQPHGNMALETLEPEAANSFISFSVYQTGTGETLPIYRYLKNEKL
jgi:hypothetical protein